MTWVVRKGVQVWTGTGEPMTPDAAAYRYCAVPLADRPRKSCGRPGYGRSQHKKHGELTCQVCAKAEAEYAADRRTAS